MTPAVFILSYSNLIRYDCSHIVHVCILYFVHILIIVWGLLNLDIITSTPPLECLHCYLCVICNSNRFHSLHNDCSHIGDVHRRRRSRAEFGLVFSGNKNNVVSFRVKMCLILYNVHVLD